jgi:hypothetical protein
MQRRLYTLFSRFLHGTGQRLHTINSSQIHSPLLGDKVDYSVPGFQPIAGRALCHSQLYPLNQELWIGPLVTLTWKSFYVQQANYRSTQSYVQTKWYTIHTEYKLCRSKRLSFKCWNRTFLRESCKGNGASVAGRCSYFSFNPKYLTYTANDDQWELNINVWIPFMYSQPPYFQNRINSINKFQNIYWSFLHYDIGE